MRKFDVRVSRLEYTHVEIKAENEEKARAAVEAWPDEKFQELEWAPAECIPYEVEDVEDITPQRTLSITVNMAFQMGVDEEEGDAIDRLYDALWQQLIRGKSYEDQINFSFGDAKVEEKK